MIRPAAPGDAPALAGVQFRAWWRAYAEWVDPERFGTLEERVARWHEILAQPPEPGRSTLAWDQDGVVAGFVSVGPGRDDDVRGVGGDLMAIYVDPPAQGAGVGRALMDAGEARLRDHGYPYAVLWVFAANGFARDLYERRGWVLEPGDVVEREHGAGWWAPAVRYRLTL